MRTDSNPVALPLWVQPGKVALNSKMGFLWSFAPVEAAKMILHISGHLQPHDIIGIEGGLCPSDLL